MSTQANRYAFNAMLVACGLVAGGLGMLAVSQRHAATEAGTTPLPAASGTPAAATQRKVLYWYDPMVPGQKFDQPGKSPFMDMQLVPRYADESEPNAETEARPSLAVSTQAQQALGLRRATGQRRAIGAAI